MAKSKVHSMMDEMKKKYGESVADVNIAGVCKRVVLDSPQLNYDFGGGFPIGRVVEFFGPESGGKTTVSTTIGGSIQRRKDGLPNKVLFIDMEHTFDRDHALTTGLDVSEENFIFIRPLNGEQGFDIAEDYVKTGEIGLIIWDSIASTPSASQMADENGKASFGATARVFSDGLKKINPYLSRFNCSMILINQVRAKIGGMAGYGPQENTPGGHAPKFYASWRARVSRVEDILDKKEIIGNSIRVKNVKSKIGYPKRTAQMDLYYATGFSHDAEYIDFILKLGIVKQAGAWVSNEEWGFRGQGRNSLLEYLHDHPDLFTKVKEQVNATFAAHSVLDDGEEDASDEDYPDEETVDTAL